MNKYAIQGFLALIRKQITRIIRISTQVIFPPLISQGLYFVIFGGIIGSQINKINGVSYMEYIVPGLVMMSIITNSFSNVSTTTYTSKMMKNIEEIMQSPVPKWIVILGYTGGGVIRGLINGLLITLLALFFIPISFYNIILAILFAMITSFFFSLLGYLAGIFSKSFDEVTIVPTFILTPLTYLAGVFYDINSLPVFWQNVSKFNPMTYIIDGFRFSFFGFSYLNVWLSLGVLTLSSIIVFLIDWKLTIDGFGVKN